MAFQVQQVNIKTDTFLVQGMLDGKSVTVEISMNGWPADSWTIQEISEAAEVQAQKSNPTP